MIKISNEELRTLLVGPKRTFPKYSSPVINLINGYAGGTRPKIVGQMSELVKDCPAQNFEDWRSWYLERKPEAISDATQKIMSKLQEIKKVVNEIDEKVVREWVEDLVIEKTFMGMRFQSAILKALAEKSEQTYRLSNPNEEARGIDGFIGGKAISIKPVTYKLKNTSEKIEAKIIYYEKKKDGIVIFDE